MKRLVNFFIILSFVLSGCSPKLSQKDFSAPITDLKPDLEKDRDFAKLLQHVNQFEMEWKGQIQSAEVHDVIQSLLYLSEKYKNPNLKATASVLYKKYYSEPVGTSVSFFKTPYYQIFQEEALPSVRDAFEEGSQRLDTDLGKVKAKLIELKNTYPWPKKAKFKESVALIQGYLDAFVALVPKMKLLPAFTVALLKEVKDEKDVNIDYLNKQWTAIDSKKTLDNMITILEGMVKEFDIPLDKDSVDKITAGKVLAVKIGDVKDELSAFSAIVAVWFILSPKERESYFMPISSSLYKFMIGHKDSELTCFVEKSCPKLIDSLIRDFGVLPQIKKFGVENLKNTLNEKTHGYVLEILEERLLNVVLNLDARVTKKVVRNVVKAKDGLDTQKNNAQGFTKEKFLNWLMVNLDLKDDVTMAYEFPLIEVDMQKRAVSFVVPVQPRNVVNTRSVGASLGTNAKMIETDILPEKHLRRTIIEQVNRVMGFGGIPTNGAPTRGLVRNFENEVVPYDVGSAVTSLLSFGLADRIDLGAPYLRKDSTEPVTVSSLSQIELGTGLLSLMKYLRDWESNSFDTLLGSYKASDVFGSEAGKNDPKLFSKTDFFGMVTAQFLNWISNLNKGYSQIGLVTDNNEIVWLNEYAKYKDKKLLYGVYVDIVNGQRSPDVNIEAIAKLLRLLKSVQGVVTGIEKTQFKELQKKDITDPECRDLKSPKCPSFAQIIAKQVDQVKQIILPLGNTVATKFRKQKASDAPGMCYGMIKLPTMEPVEKRASLMDQLYVIESLIYVYDTTKIESYMWAAKETYSYLQKYYNPKSNFFEMETKVASVPMVVQMLRTFKLLLPYLDDTERVILSEKIKVWEFGLERIQ